MKSANEIVLKVLGVLLLTSAVLKGWQLLVEPVANDDIFSYRPFLILVVEFEVALGIWLLSGLLKKAAWLVSIICFILFCFITLYKGVIGAESCGCFGSVHVNPWITLFVIDIPASLALAIFRPIFKDLTVVSQSGSYCGSEVGLIDKVKVVIDRLIMPLPSASRFITTVGFGLIILFLVGGVLFFNEPAKATVSYEVLEPETWLGDPLPVVKDIDVDGDLKEGAWLVLFYHHDCPECIAVIKRYRMGIADFVEERPVEIAFVEVPPYGKTVIGKSLHYVVGKLSDKKKWFVATPAVVLLEDGMVQMAWEGKTPELKIVLDKVATLVE